MIPCSNTLLPSKHRIKKDVSQIKAMIEIPKLLEWYFTASILTSPQTSVVEQQIRQAFFVFDTQRPQEILVVILTEPAVRKYCNILRPFSKIHFINGSIKKSHLNNNYVLITVESSLQQVHEENEIFIRQKRQQRPTKAKSVNFHNYNERLNNCLNIHSDFQIYEDSSEESQYQLTTKSQKIQLKKQTINSELVTFCGAVINSYEVGKGKINHGIGYRIEQCFSMLNYEVVIWSDLKCDLLKIGESYEFSHFRVHKKHNLQISYHSHPQHSTVTPLI